MDIGSFATFTQYAQKSQVFYYYHGEFSPPIVEAAAHSLKARMADEGTAAQKSRKLFSTFIEMAQNVMHYGVQAQNAGGQDVDAYHKDWGPWDYRGEARDGLRDGYGACQWPLHPGGNVATYTGQWQRGRMCGWGRLTRPNSGVYDLYVGRLQDGKMHGWGRYTWATRGGRVYEGHWDQDEMRGWGRMTAGDGTVEHDGWWAHDEPAEQLEQ